MAVSSRVLLALLTLASACAHAGDDRQNGVEVVKRQHAAIWSAGRLELIPEFFHRDFVGHFPRGEVRGRAGIRNAVLAHRQAFPDWSETVVDVIAEGDKVVTRFNSRGTNLGPFFGNPPTGRTVEISEVCIYRLVDGLIAEQWVYPDIVAMQAQLGARDD